MKKQNEQRRVIERQIKSLIKELNLDITFGDVKEMIWNEETIDDYNHLIGTFVEKAPNIKEANEICQIVSTAWNNLPHKSLNGLSPMEMVGKSKSSAD